MKDEKLFGVPADEFIAMKPLRRMWQVAKTDRLTQALILGAIILHFVRAYVAVR